MAYNPCSFDRNHYLKHRKLFEEKQLDCAEEELCEFNDDAEDLAFELAYSRHRIARLEEFIRNGVDLGYIVVPEQPDPARDTIDEICGIKA